MASPSSAPMDATPFVPTELPALDNTMGAWLIGTFIGLLLQGVAYHQTYQYYRLYPNDARWLKTLVFLVTVVETFNSVLDMHACYFYLITNYSSPLIFLSAPVWTIKLAPVPASLAAVLTQFFFARRVYMIDRRFRPIAILAGCLVVAFSGCFTALAVLGWDAKDAAEYSSNSQLVTVGCGLILVGDFLLTTSLIYFLRHNRTGIIRTDSMLDVIIMYTVSSGLIICISNVLSVAFSVAWPDSLLYPANSVVLTKLYTNSLLVSLNAREALNNRSLSLNVADSMQFRSDIVKQTSRSRMSMGHRHIEVPFQENVYRSNLRQSDSTAVELKVMPQDFVTSDSDNNHSDLERGGTDGKAFLNIS